MKQTYIKPASHTLKQTLLMESVIVSSPITADPEEGLGRRFTESWDFNENLDDIYTNP